VFSTNVTGRSQSVWSSHCPHGAGRVLRPAQALAQTGSILQYSGITFLVASRKNSGSNFGTMTKACQCNTDTNHGHRRIAFLCFTMSNNANNALMHRNNRAAFLLRRIESESARAIIAPYCASLNKPFFWCLSHQATLDSRHVSCAPIYGAHQL
jgi:hypothetical protein